MTEGDNARITLAILGEKIDSLHAAFAKYADKIDEGQIERHSIDTRLARVEERLTIYAAALMVFSIVASAIAAYMATVIR